jgi:predicted amidohydrolase
MRPARAALLLLLACTPTASSDDDDSGATGTTGDTGSGDPTSTGAGGYAPVRAFAVGNHHGLGYVDDYAAFTAEMQRLMHAVEPDLADGHNLVVFGEDVGLPAAFLGSRGAAARTQGSATAAYLAVATAYQPIYDHYRAAWPDISINRGIALALTDTMARAFFGTFPALAEQYGVHLSACTLLPKLTTSNDPDDLEFFGDPDVADETLVYLAAGPEVYNVCYLWGPDGAEIGSSRKVNLVDLEGPDLLDLSPEQLANVVAYDLPFGRVAIAISLDAFIPAYVGHLHDLGAQIVLQNDANPGRWVSMNPRADHIEPSDGSLIWQPEEWRDSTIRMVEHPDYAGIQYNVCPMIVGNLFDLEFDGQSSITARNPPAELPPRAYVGDAPQARFLALAPWVVPDPGDADPDLTLAQRREALMQVGEALAPGSGDPRENGYVESIVWADLQVQAIDN